MGNVGWHRKLAITLLSVLPSFLSVGCVPKAAYQPDEGLVQALGVREAHRRFHDTLARAVTPRVVDIDITDDAVAYVYELFLRGPYRIPVGKTPATRLQKGSICKSQ
jgi:hypothetical protein